MRFLALPAALLLVVFALTPGGAGAGKKSKSEFGVGGRDLTAAEREAIGDGARMETRAEKPGQQKVEEKKPWSPFMCHPRTFECVGDAIWACEAAYFQRIIWCANLRCANGTCTWPRDNGRGAILKVDMGECCGYRDFELNVPEKSQLETLSWEKAAAGLP